MKFSCLQENLTQGLAVVNHLATKNTNLPILSNILLKVEDKNLKLISTNLEIGISCLVRAKTEQDGDFTVDAKLISDYINLLPNEKVNIILAENQLLIDCKNYNTKIKGLSANEYPLIPQITKEQPLVCRAKDFRQAISEVMFAVSTAETRPEISGVFVNFNQTEQVIVFAATDSYRLTEKKIPLLKSDKSAKNNTVIIPAKTLQEISRILGILKDELIDEENKDLEIYLTENQILFVYNNIELVSRIIEGHYPDYKQIIPQSFKTTAIINANELIKVVKAVSLFTKSGIFDIKLDLQKEKNQIVVSASNNQLGENTAIITAEISGEENSVVLNYRYLLDGMQNINSEQVVFSMNDSMNPVMISPDKKDDYLYIIMPIKQ